jgi:SAM-dependent methyltransferase
MLRNLPKYRLFSDAFAAIVRGKKVLDIGTGSGILSLLCVAHGAATVVAVDREPVTGMTRAVLGRYRQGKAVHLWEGDVFDLDCAAPDFDVIISETIGYLGFEENVVAILSYARHHFGSSKTIVIPSDIDVLLEPTRIGGIIDNHAPYLTLETNDLPGFEHLSVRSSLKLGMPSCHVQTAAETWRAIVPQTINAVAVYFDVGLLEATRITNKANPYWPHCIVPLACPVQVDEGEIVVCRLHLEPSDQETYQVAICLQDHTGRVFSDRRFESLQILADLLPSASNTVDAVIQEVENVLRSLDLCHRLA